MRFYLFSICLFLLSVSVFAQTDSSKYNREEFILDQKIYRPYSNYLTLNAGASYNINLATIEQLVNIGYCFRVKKYFFQTGYQVSSNRFVLYRSLQKLNSLYTLWGIRKEDLHKNIGIFLGPTYVYGSYYTGENSWGKDLYHGLTHHFGVLAKAEYTYKLFYDIGVGTSLFVNWNTEYPIAGISFLVYFSGAYRGEAPDER
jgi:hypothetical protein